MDRFIEQANKFHPTIKFTAEISENESTFIDTVVFKGGRFTKESILDIIQVCKTLHLVPSPGVKRGFIHVEAVRLLRTNSSNKTFEVCLTKFKLRLEARGYKTNNTEVSVRGKLYLKTIGTQTKKKGHEKLLPYHRKRVNLSSLDAYIGIPCRPV